jgi:hypothetical protein
MGSVENLVSFNYSLNFSIDIASWGVASAAGVSRSYSKIFNLLQFAPPFWNGKKVETIDMVSLINPRFPATINSPKSVFTNISCTISAEQGNSTRGLNQPSPDAGFLSIPECDG